MAYYPYTMLGSELRDENLYLRLASAQLDHYLLIAACNVTYAGNNDGIAVKTTIPGHDRLGDWETKTMISDDPYIDERMRREMTGPVGNREFDRQAERSFRDLDALPPGQALPPSDIGGVGEVRIGFLPKQ